MARPRKIIPGLEADAFTVAIDKFKAARPDQWESLRLCPLQHGVEEIAEALKNGL